MSVGRVERHFVAVHCKKILSKENPDVLQQIAEPPNDRVVAANGVPRLGDIDDEEHHHDQRAQANREHEQRRENGEKRVQKLRKGRGVHGEILLIGWPTSRQLLSDTSTFDAFWYEPSSSVVIEAGIQLRMTFKPWPETACFAGPTA